MKESKYQFQDPHMTALEFKDNVNFDPDKFEQLKMDCNSNVKKRRLLA